jgi:threonine dehydrogenase-like Zn-dependent dehydrogenase
MCHAKVATKNETLATPLREYVFDKQLKIVNGIKLISKMKSAVIAAPQQIVFEELSIPQPSSNEVLIQMEGCGICASNLPVWEGREWFAYPQDSGSPGHEGWGYIVKIGDKVKNLHIGDKVTALSYHAFSQYDKAKAENVVVLPESLHKQPFPGEPLGCAWNIFERSDIQRGQTVAIVGVGFIGALLTQLVKQAGTKVIALSRRKSSLDMAQKLGADEIIPLDDHYQIIEKVKDLTQGKFCDRVIEATGKEWPLNLAGELTKIRGKLIIAGFHQDGMRQINVQLWNWRGLDIINAHERDPEKYVYGMQKAIEAVVNGWMNPAPLYTHHFKFNEIQEAFKVHTSAPAGFIKAIINID